MNINRLCAFSIFCTKIEFDFDCVNATINDFTIFFVHDAWLQLYQENVSQKCLKLINFNYAMRKIDWIQLDGKKAESGDKSQYVKLQ